MSEGKYVGWRKSSHSNSSGNCVEVAGLDRVAVRDSQEHGRGLVLQFTATAWHRFLADAKSGKLEH